MLRHAGEREVRAEVLEEGHDQVRGVLALRLQRDQDDRDQHTGDDLERELAASGESEVAVVDDLQVVVGESDGAKGDGAHYREPHELVAEVRPQYRGHDDGDGDEDAAHGGRARFFLVRLRAFFADVLADLEITELADDRRTDDQAHEQRRQRGERRAERQETEDAERRKEGAEVENLFVEQPKEQSFSVPSRRSSRTLLVALLGPDYYFPEPAKLCHFSSARSRRTPREA